MSSSVGSSLNTSGTIGSQSSSASDSSWWSTNKDYPYTATLSALGNPDLILLDYVQVNPLFNGIPHHTKGIYQIIGITNSIAKDGFFSDLSLIKMSDQLS